MHKNVRETRHFLDAWRSGTHQTEYGERSAMIISTLLMHKLHADRWDTTEALSYDIQMLMTETETSGWIISIAMATKQSLVHVNSRDGEDTTVGIMRM